MGLKELRALKKVSKIDICKKTSLSYDTIGSIESGRLDINHCNLLFILELCDVLDCKVSDLITDEEKIKYYSSLIKKSVKNKRI